MAQSTAAGPSAKDLVKFLEFVGNLKHLKRTGWVLRNVQDCETVSAHMYRMAMVTFLLDGSEGLDRTKCMELALVHDLAECIVGDITPYCGISREEKKRREMKAMDDITGMINPRGNRMMELFHEYEESTSPESRFIKDLDRLDMVLQAFEYEKRDNCVGKHKEFIDSVHGKNLHPLVGGLIDEIKAQREILMKEKEEKEDTKSS
uniref:5'-deoxynucleotidase HDDC2 n=1 Tax=Nyssomyia neivai TaxID=330878 RepID=A0A1L8DAW6_9DIPT